MVFDQMLPELIKSGALMRISVMNKHIFADCKPKRENREETPLFGHVIDQYYMPPANDAWMHPEEEEEHDDAQLSPPHQHFSPPQQPSPHQTPPQQPSSHQTPPIQSSSHQTPPTQPSPHHSPLTQTSHVVDDSGSSSSDDDDDDDDDDTPVTKKNTVRKRVGGVFVNVEKRRRLTDDDMDADYVPPQTEMRHVSTSVSIPAPATTSSDIPPPISEYENFPSITDAVFVENLDDINIDLGPSSSQVNDLESQVNNLTAKVASLIEEVERLRKENKEVVGLRS